MRSRLGALLVLCILSAVLVTVTGSPATAASFVARASRTAPAVGEAVRVSGAVPPAKRVVQLQTMYRGHWTPLRSVRTAAGGRYAFSVRASAQLSYYRVVALRWGRYSARASNVVGVKATVATSFTAQVDDLAPMLGDAVRVSGAVAPAGRTIWLQVMSAGHWTTAVTARTGAGGRFAFTVRAAADLQYYRVVSPWGSGYPTRASNTLTVQGTSPGIDLAAPVVDRAGGVVADAAALFRPARPGAAVRLYRSSDGGSSFSYVTTAAQDARGVATFPGAPGGPAGSPFVYRAETQPDPGGPSYTSAGSTSVLVNQMSFADEFDGTALGARWHARLQGFMARRQCSRTDGGLVDVAGGVATLRVQQIGAATALCPDGTWNNATITTGTLARPYGYYSARVRFPQDRGMHAGFWLQGGTEVDIVEHFGYHRPISNLIHSGSVNTGDSVGGDQPQSRAVLGSSTPWSDFHTYSVQWSPAGYVFRLDGVPTLSTTLKNTVKAPEIILSLQTSDWELPFINRSTVASPAGAMQVDWVHAYQ